MRREFSCVSQLSRQESIQALTFWRRSSAASKCTPNDLVFRQLTTPRTHRRGRVSSEKETSTFVPEDISSELLSDIPPELISRLLQLKRRPSEEHTTDTSVI